MEDLSTTEWRSKACLKYVGVGKGAREGGREGERGQGGMENVYDVGRE